MGEKASFRDGGEAEKTNECATSRCSRLSCSHALCECFVGRFSCSFDIRRESAKTCRVMYAGVSTTRTLWRHEFSGVCVKT